jgi:hypothetical protein
MFKPGHLHRSNPCGEAQLPPYHIDVFYEVRQDAQEGVLMHFRLEGEIAGQAFVEEFDMHRDTAFNFASRVAKAAAKHGLPMEARLILPSHAEYNAMFDDIRDQLGVHPGEPVNMDNVEKDRR